MAALSSSVWAFARAASRRATVARRPIFLMKGVCGSPGHRQSTLRTSFCELQRAALRAVDSFRIAPPTPPFERIAGPLAGITLEQENQRMSSSVNKVILIGRLGKDPEIRSTPQGTTVAKFTMATDERFTDRNGEKQERTEWHNFVAWAKLAEICGQYL